VGRPDDHALECMALLAFKTSLSSITLFMLPIFRYLDDYGWPLQFAVRCFLLLADKTGLPSGDILCHEIIKHVTHSYLIALMILLCDMTCVTVVNIIDGFI
jgi:hypothetical protein